MRFTALTALLLMCQLVVAQLHMTIGFGPGTSDHAESYEIDEGFTIRYYSGFRPINLEGKIGWTFADMTSIYAVGRYSPPNASISPYKESYTGGAIYQKLPFAQWCSIIAGVGHKKASTKRHGALGEGTMIDLAIAFNVTGRVNLEIHNIHGKMNNQYYSMIDNENKILVTVTFGIGSFFGKKDEEFDY